jgi:hypothetical protein
MKLSSDSLARISTLALTVSMALPLFAFTPCSFNMPGYGEKQSSEINGGNVRDLTGSDWGVAAAALQRGAEAMLNASTAGDVMTLMDPEAGTGWKLAAAASIALDAAGVGNVPVISTGTARQVAKEAAQSVADNSSNARRFIVDAKGNTLPVGAGETIAASPNGQWIQVRDATGKPTGLRMDGGHPETTHPDPRGQIPHAHVPGVTNQDGTPWLPMN